MCVSIHSSCLQQSGVPVNDLQFHILVSVLYKEKYFKL